MIKYLHMRPSVFIDQWSHLHAVALEVGAFLLHQRCIDLKPASTTHEWLDPGKK